MTCAVSVNNLPKLSFVILFIIKIKTICVKSTSKELSPIQIIKLLINLHLAKILHSSIKLIEQKFMEPIAINQQSIDLSPSAK